MVRNRSRSINRAMLVTASSLTKATHSPILPPPCPYSTRKRPPGRQMGLPAPAHPRPTMTVWYPGMTTAGQLRTPSALQTTSLKLMLTEACIYIPRRLFLRAQTSPGRLNLLRTGFRHRHPKVKTCARRAHTSVRTAQPSRRTHCCCGGTAFERRMRASKYRRNGTYGPSIS